MGRGSLTRAFERRPGHPIQGPETRQPHDYESAKKVEIVGREPGGTRAQLREALEKSGFRWRSALALL